MGKSQLQRRRPQYFWIDRIFDWDADPSSFVFQLFHTSRPGTLDTSLVSTDNINNPRTMNAVYNLGPRLEHAAVARKNSAYWGATEQQTVDMALFFLKSTAPHKLKDAPGGEAYLTKNKGQLERGSAGPMTQENTSTLATAATSTTWDCTSLYGAAAVTL